MFQKSMRQTFKALQFLHHVSNFSHSNSVLNLWLSGTWFLVGRDPAAYSISNASVAGSLHMFLYFYVSSPPSDLVSTVITRPLCNCLVKKVNHGTDLFSHKHTELPASSFSIICVLKHVRTRLTILTGSKNNHKIKVAHPSLRTKLNHGGDRQWNWKLLEWKWNWFRWKWGWKLDETG